MTRLHILVALVVCALLGSMTPAQADVITDWNARTMICVGGLPPTIPPNRGGPTGSLDIALVQAAVHDAVQAIEGRFEAYHYRNPAMLGAGSPEAAAAVASYRTLVALYGADDPCLNGVVDPATTYAGDGGVQAGIEAAAALRLLYRPAFVVPTDPFVGGTNPGEWRLTPGVTQGANTYLPFTQPFVLLRPSQFRPEPPAPLTSVAYLRDYDEVKELGSVGSTSRTTDQTDMARFWGNFGGQWFEALRAITNAHVPDIGDKARVFALVSLTTADTTISVFETKYHYNFWRPITAIREGDNDGNQRTVGDSEWTPFLLTPAYPDHSSGANNFTGGFTTILQLFFGTDEFEFSVSSGAAGLLTNPRRYTRFSDAAQEVVDVRVLQGIHFRFADEAGRRQGSRIAHWTFQRFLRPLPGSH
jgi:hypothetical protein